MKFKIGKDSSILMRCTFNAAKGFEMGKNSVINANCSIDKRGTVKIGDNVSISADVIILTADHDMDNNMQGRQKLVLIDNFVWIGTRAMILPGCTIKKGAVVASGSVVTKSVGEREVVAGIPARMIKTRKESFDYTVNYRRLLQ